MRPDIDELMELEFSVGVRHSTYEVEFSGGSKDGRPAFKITMSAKDYIEALHAEIKKLRHQQDKRR